MRAAQATALLQLEIDQLWHDSVTSDNGPVTERMVEVSHAVRQVCHMLDRGYEIG
ncbi:MAG: hypothetical protein ABI706_18970 [Ilumatobacteraceae bacterium]